MLPVNVGIEKKTYQKMKPQMHVCKNVVLQVYTDMKPRHLWYYRASTNLLDKKHSTIYVENELLGSIFKILWHIHNSGYSDARWRGRN